MTLPPCIRLLFWPELITSIPHFVLALGSISRGISFMYPLVFVAGPTNTILCTNVTKCEISAIGRRERPMRRMPSRQVFSLMPHDCVRANIRRRQTRTWM